ncbi:MAG: hypothetical protein H0X33_00890 [Taibaiella sp.]|nr:hypothetical protein [Taibaiella sp.]
MESIGLPLLKLPLASAQKLKTGYSSPVLAYRTVLVALLFIGSLQFSKVFTINESNNLCLKGGSVFLKMEKIQLT